MDLHIERLYIQMDGEEEAERSHWAALRDTGGWENYTSVQLSEGGMASFATFLEGVSLVLLEVDYSKVGIRQQGTAGES